MSERQSIGSLPSKAQASPVAQSQRPPAGSARPIETLVVVSSLLNNMALRHDQVLSLSMQAISDLIRADAGALLLLDEQRSELEVHGACGAYTLLEGRRFAAAEGLAGWVSAQGKSVLLDEATEDPRFDHAFDLDTGFSSGSVLVVPLQIKGRTTGALLFARARGGQSFGAEDRTFVRAASHQLAIAQENVRLASALDAATLEAEKVERAKSHFMSLVSHELLTPLTLLNAQIDILEAEAQQGAAPGVAELLPGLRSAMQRLEYVTDEVLNMVLLDRGELPLHPEPLDVGELLGEVRAMMLPSARRRHIELVCVDNGEPLSATIDRWRIQQVLVHLVLNAIRYTPDGGRIALAYGSTPTGLRLSVKDNGIGIPRQEHERIFEKMVELGSIEHHHSGLEGFLCSGIGLGLSIARGIVQAHGGRIWVESAEGAGSCFLIDLPVEVARLG